MRKIIFFDILSDFFVLWSGAGKTMEGNPSN